ILMPSLLAVNTIGHALAMEKSRRGLFTIGGCLALALPVVLELTGVSPRSYLFHDGLITLVPHGNRFPELPTLVFLTVANLVVIAGASLFVGRVRSALTAAERRLQLQTWQLRRLVPDEARGAVETVPPPWMRPGNTTG